MTSLLGLSAVMVHACLTAPLAISAGCPSVVVTVSPESAVAIGALIAAANVQNVAVAAATIIALIFTVMSLPCS